MFRNIAILAMAALFGTFANGASKKERDFKCRFNKDKNDYFQLTYDSKSIKYLKIEGYEIIVNSAQQEDEKIGHSVFAVKVGRLVSTQGTKELNINLQDYSDIQSWKIILSESSHEAAVVSTFKSSDGDDLLHVNSSSLTCK